MRKHLERVIWVLIALGFVVLGGLKLANQQFEASHKVTVSHEKSLEKSSPIKPIPVNHSLSTLPSDVVNRKHYLLGSPTYVNELSRFALEMGPRGALTVIMSDVDLYDKELDENSFDNIERLHKLISHLVHQYGKVDPELHYFRNKLNRAPKNLKALMAYNAKAPLNKRWKLLSPINSMYHMQGSGGEFHVKFDAYDGYCEAVYDKAGNLLDDKTDPINMGTYNYAAGIAGFSAHTQYDVKPYLAYGNVPNGNMTNPVDVTGRVDSAYSQYKIHQLEVYQYRKMLFGIQSGPVL